MAPRCNWQYDLRLSTNIEENITDFCFLCIFFYGFCLIYKIFMNSFATCRKSTFCQLTRDFCFRRFGSQHHIRSTAIKSPAGHGLFLRKEEKRFSPTILLIDVTQIDKGFQVFLLFCSDNIVRTLVLSLSFPLLSKLHNPSTKWYQSSVERLLSDF